MRSGFPFSTMYVASSAARPVPTFLAECVGQLADEVRPLLIAATRDVLSD